MGRLLPFLLSILLLCGCGRQSVQPVFLPLTERPAVEAPHIPEWALTIDTPPVWDGSDIQQGEPITPQPGDTAATWDMGRAADFPTDDACTDLQLLQKWLAVEGLTFADLSDRNCTQLILTVARQEDGLSTITTCYTFEDNAWYAEPSLLRMHGYVGSNGIAHDRQRNTRQSPAGLWKLGAAFGLAEKPENLRLAWRDITPQSDWVCDADSPYFNTWQERDDPALIPWNYYDVEHLEDYSVTYRYACVMEYNTPPYTVPDRGCAIFLHCSDHPTGGCVGLLEEDMVRTLLWLDPRENPYILVTGHEKPESTPSA